MSPPAKASFLERLPPPLGFVAAFLAGMLLQRLAWPAAGASPAALVALGVAFAVIGAASALSAIGLFVAGRTTVLPHGQPTRFVVRGPYRWTRNPMYLGLALAYLGVAASTGTWLAIPLLALPLLHLSWWVIPLEEAGLRERFGQEFADYARRVRRWL